mgnify:CR=1 FL=1|tara:strand:+ start:2002 stop:2256 length:255 start_codon:yes stop_codon:yes gene_type:complete
MKSNTGEDKASKSTRELKIALKDLSLTLSQIEAGIEENSVKILKEQMLKIDDLSSGLADRQLKHFIAQHSYEKALLYLEDLSTY